MEFTFDTHDLAGMTHEDAGDVIESADYVLPTGSTEQHSIHLPLFVDSLRAAALSERLANQAHAHGLELAVLPTLPYGESEHHMQFPGTITLAPDTYQDVIVDIGSSISRHGADRFLVLNCHGGNRRPISLAMDRLGREHDINAHFVHWTDYAREYLQDEFGDDWGHAGDHETSVIELFYPDLVKESRKEPQKTTNGAQTRSYRYFDELTEQGGLGDPTASDPQAVDEIVDKATNEILEALAEDR
ncbi:MAG: creatininase family protein [Halobacteriaceae archaeon]